MKRAEALAYLLEMGTIARQIERSPGCTPGCKAELHGFWQVYRAAQQSCRTPRRAIPGVGNACRNELELVLHQLQNARKLMKRPPRSKRAYPKGTVFAGLRYHLATCYGPSSRKPVGAIHCICMQDLGKARQPYRKRGCAFRYWSAKQHGVGKWRFLDDAAFRRLVRGKGKKSSRISEVIERVKRERGRRKP